MTQTCWTLTSGKIGCQKQVNGLAKALGLPFEEKVFERKSPWHLLPTRLDLNPIKHGKPHCSTLAPPYPDILIGCGIRSIPFMFATKKASGGKTALIYVQHPRIHPKHFDAIIAPTHDRLLGKNVISILGATHDITPDLLNSEANSQALRFQQYPGPYTAIFLGGATKNYPFTKTHAKQLAKQLTSIAEQHRGSLLISPSRRTGEKAVQLLKQALSKYQNIYFYDQTGDNPYYAMLGLADTIFVTDDSVSMISEACSTGKPVFLLALPEFKHSRKMAQFIQEAKAGNHLKYYTDSIVKFPIQTLNETQRILPELKQLLANKVAL